MTAELKELGVMVGATARLDTKGEWVTLTPWVNGVGYGTMYLSPRDARELAKELENYADKVQFKL
jgi:hypothetical protein